MLMTAIPDLWLALPMSSRVGLRMVTLFVSIIRILKPFALLGGLIGEFAARFSRYE